MRSVTNLATNSSFMPIMRTATHTSNSESSPTGDEEMRTWNNAHNLGLGSFGGILGRTWLCKIRIRFLEGSIGVEIACAKGMWPRPNQSCISMQYEPQPFSEFLNIDIAVIVFGFSQSLTLLLLFTSKSHPVPLTTQHTGKALMGFDFYSSNNLQAEGATVLSEILKYTPGITELDLRCLYH